MKPRASEALALRLLELMPTSIIAVDAGGSVLYANANASATLRRAHALEGSDVRELFAHNAELEAALERLAPGSEGRVDFGMNAGAERIEIGMSLVRPERAAGGPACLLVFRDLADRRQFESEVRRVERLSAIGHMVAGFAHEIRNPVAGIQALMEAMLAETAGGDARREYVLRVLPLLERIENFVQACLRFGQPRLPVRRRVEPASLLPLALVRLAPRWRGAKPQAAVEPALPSVEVDREQIADALAALIDNALDAAGGAARVGLAVRGEGRMPARRVCFQVSDEGEGIPEADLARVFDPFFSTKPKALGLGLTIAQTMVRENFGHLTMQSRPGRTVVHIWLPEAQA